MPAVRFTRAMRKGVFMALIAYSGSAGAEPTTQDFFNMVYSQATFLEQCVARGAVRATDVHNANLRKAQSLGFVAEDFWNAAQRGGRGEVFDLLQGKWVKVDINKKWCEHVRREQIKLQNTLSRY